MPQVSVIKVKIHEATGMPAGKQKLQYEVNYFSGTRWLFKLWILKRARHLMTLLNIKILTLKTEISCFVWFSREFSSKIPTLWRIITWTMDPSFIWPLRKEEEGRSRSLIFIISVSILNIYFAYNPATFVHFITCAVLRRKTAVQSNQCLVIILPMCLNVYEWLNKTTFNIVVS